VISGKCILLFGRLKLEFLVRLQMFDLIYNQYQTIKFDNINCHTKIGDVIKVG
jgi:hypothetical protein